MVTAPHNYAVKGNWGKSYPIWIKTAKQKEAYLKRVLQKGD